MYNYPVSIDLFYLVSPAISVSPEVKRMGELLCLHLFKGKCLHSQQLCTALGQISALNFPPSSSTKYFQETGSYFLGTVPGF